MHRCKKTLQRFLELVTGERLDKLEVAYATAAPSERAEARDRFIEEKAKHRITTAATALGAAALALLLEKLLPEA